MESKGIREYSVEDLERLIASNGIVEAQIDAAANIVLLGNRADLHRFLVGISWADFQYKNGRVSNDPEGAPGIDFIGDASRIRMRDINAYGAPFYSHPVYFNIGSNPVWRVMANPRIPVPQLVAPKPPVVD